MQNERDLVAALEQIDKGLAQVKGSGAGTASLAGINPCAEYKKIRPVIDIVIKIAENLPFGVGKRIVAVLKTLESILDALCPQH